MTTFVPCSRSQPFLLPPDMEDWLPDDDLAHFVVAAVERVPVTSFAVNARPSGKPQYHPRLMLAVLVYAYANGVFSSRRIERATHRDLGMRYVAANTHPDHDTIAAFRRNNRAAFEAAFLQVLLLARQMGLLHVGTVSVDGTKLDASASKVRTVRYDRAQALRAKLAADIAALTEQAEAADAAGEPDPQALPRATARRQALRAKLDAACATLEAEAAAAHARDQDTFDAKQAAWDGKTGPRGRPPVPPDPAVPPGRCTNLTDADSALMRRSAHHEYRQAYNAQAVVDADGSQLVLATHVTRCAADAPSFLALVLAMALTVGLPARVLADTGFAQAEAVAGLRERGIEPLVAVGSTQGARPYDFRPPPDIPKAVRAVHEPWRIAMKATLQTPAAQTEYRKRMQTIEPVFGTIKQAMGFRRFSLRGLHKVQTEWTLVALAHNCKRIARMMQA